MVYIGLHLVDSVGKSCALPRSQPVNPRCYHRPPPETLCAPGLLLALCAPPPPTLLAPITAVLTGLFLPPARSAPALSRACIRFAFSCATASASSYINAFTTTRSPKSRAVDPETYIFSLDFLRAAMAVRAELLAALDRPGLFDFTIVA